MQEIINCPSCQRKLQVPEALLGQDVQCPTCGATFVASWGSQPPPLPPHAPLPAGQPPHRPDSSSPPGPSGYEQNRGYGGPPPAYPRRNLLPHRGGTILTLGILSMVVCGPVLGPIAWIMGNQDLNEMRAGRMDPEGRDATNTGRILGMITSIFWLVVVAVFCLLIAFAAATARPGGFR